MKPTLVIIPLIHVVRTKPIIHPVRIIVIVGVLLLLVIPGVEGIVPGTMARPPSERQSTRTWSRTVADVLPIRETTLPPVTIPVELAIHTTIVDVAFGDVVIGMESTVPPPPIGIPRATTWHSPPRAVPRSMEVVLPCIVVDRNKRIVVHKSPISQHIRGRGNPSSTAYSRDRQRSKEEDKKNERPPLRNIENPPQWRQETPHTHSTASQKQTNANERWGTCSVHRKRILLQEDMQWNIRHLHREQHSRTKNISIKCFCRSTIRESCISFLNG